MQAFNELNLPDPLFKSLNSIGFIKPTEIQSKAIPFLMDGRDVLACSETGSGKTAAYLIPMLTYLLDNPKESGLILAPTRELAQQISQFLQSLVRNSNNFNVATLLGGQDIRKQFKTLQRKPRAIVATPGRLIDHLNRNTVQIHKVSYLVLDEGDRMIDMGFEPQLKEILKFLPDERQTSFFTATLDKKVQSLTKKYLKNPASVIINSSKPVSKIKQSVVTVKLKDKDETVLNELNSRQGSVVVFLKTRYRTDRLSKFLSGFGVSVDTIHGGRNQSQRSRTIQDFKKGKIRVLCATDVAARGIDVPQIKHVINYDLPMQDEDYVHRVGRTARNGGEGEAVSFVMPGEHNDWNRLAKKYEIPGDLLAPSKGGGSGGKSGRKRGSKGGPAKRGNSRFSLKSSSKRKSNSDSGDGFGDSNKSKSRSKKKSQSDSQSDYKPRKKAFSRDSDHSDFRSKGNSKKSSDYSGSSKKKSVTYSDSNENSNSKSDGKKFDSRSGGKKKFGSGSTGKKKFGSKSGGKKFSSKSGGKKKFGSKKKSQSGGGSRSPFKSRSKSSESSNRAR